MIFQHELERSLIMYSGYTAIEQGDQHCSYEALHTQARALAQWTAEKEWPLQTPVGIYLHDRASIIRSVTGLALAGMTFVPLDPSLPEERLKMMILHAGIAQVITSRKMSATHIPAALYFLEDIPERTHGTSGTTSLPDYAADDNLYIYYTSGSTGVPKGILGRNASLLQFIKWEIQHFAIQPGYRFSQFISPYFDAFLRDIFTPLLSGGTICIPPEREDFFETGNIIEWVDTAKITWIHCVPSIFRLLNRSTLHKGLFSSLRFVLMSGERIIPAELVNWYHVFESRIQLVNLYGATESTMVRTCYFIQPEDALKAKIPIGRPIDDTWLQVLNKQMKPCKLLEPGDLYILSDYISLGYLGDTVLTQQKFITLPDDNGVLRRAYHTGDRARKLPDGAIDLLGREDRQVKLLGVRIELEEIENVLLSAARVKQAVVIKHTDEKGNETLASFITCIAPADSSVEAVQDQTAQYLRTRLPAYMIPACVVAIDSMPLLPNGKINYKKLPDYITKEQYESPATPTEEKLLGVWKEIIGEKDISVLDTFIKIGGNSLSVMRLISCIYRDFSVRITLSEIFSNPTIRKQAVLIDQAARQLSLKIPVAEIKAAYAVTASQQRLYYNFERDRQSVEYNLPMAWQISDAVSSAQIEQILNTLIARHESLRTAFHLDNGTIVQRVSDHANLRVVTIDSENTDTSEALREAVKPFDLDTVPLVRAAIVRQPNNNRTLVIDMHHIICDGISQTILKDEFIRLYNGESLPPSSFQLKDYAEWEHTYRQGTEYRQHCNFWARNFAGGIPALQLPTTRSGNGLTTAQGDEWLLIMDKESLRGLTALCAENITLYPLFLSVYFIYMLQLTGQHDMVIGVATSGRMQHEVKDVVGMFVKTLPVRYQIDENLTFAEFSAALHQYLLEAYNNQAYDLADIAAAADLSSGDRRELFSTVLSLNNYSASGLQTGQELFRHVDIHTGKAKFPFYLVIDEAKDQYGFRFEFSHDYFTAADIQILAARFQLLIQAISENPHEMIRNLLSRNTDNAVKANQEDIVFNF